MPSIVAREWYRARIRSPVNLMSPSQAAPTQIIDHGTAVTSVRRPAHARVNARVKLPALAAAPGTSAPPAKRPVDDELVFLLRV